MLGPATLAHMGLEDASATDDPQGATALSVDLARSATLGFVAGLRSVMPLALLAAHLQRNRPDIADRAWAVDVLASTPSAVGLGVAAVGEILADKLPIIPSRLEPLPLAGRVVLGGAAGALQSLAEGRASDVGALGASIGALVGSVVGYQLRTGLQRRLRLPGLVLALGEDGLAFGLGRWAVRR